MSPYVAIGACIGQPGSLYGCCAGTCGSNGCGVMCDGRVAPPLGKKPKSPAPYVLSGTEAPRTHDLCTARHGPRFSSASGSARPWEGVA